MDAKKCMGFLLKLFEQVYKNKLEDLTVRQGNLMMMKRLLDDPAVDGRTPLHYAASHRFPDMIIVSIFRSLALIWA